MPNSFFIAEQPLGQTVLSLADRAVLRGRI